MKNKFIKYPAIIFTAFFISSLYLSLLMSIFTKIIIWASALVLAVLCVFLILKCRQQTLVHFAKHLLLICAALVFSVLVQFIRYDIPVTSAQKHVNTTAHVTAYVKDVYYDLDYMSAANCIVTSINGEECNISVYAKFDGNLGLDEYEYFSTEFEFHDISTVYDNYNTKYTLISSNIFLAASSQSSPEPTGKTKTGIMPFFSNLNQSICNYMATILSDGSCGLVNAVLFGEKSGLSPETKRDFYTLGITHLLVVSGMNIALLAGIADTALLKIFRMKKGLRSIACALISVIYAALCGFSLTVIRAALMQVICRLSVNLKARYHNLSSLFISAMLICTVFPTAIYDIGLILSFLATLGIITYGEYAMESMRKLPSFIKGTLSSLTASLAAVIFVLPVSYFAFKNISLISPVATLIFGLFLDILLYIIPILLLTSFIPVLGPAVAWATDLLCKGILKLTETAVYFKDWFLSLEFGGSEILILLLVASIFTGFVLKPRVKILKVLPALAVFLAIALACLLNANKDGVYYMNDKSNDAIIINYGKENALIDISTGSKQFLSNSLNEVYSKTKSTSLDIYVLSHYHSKHINSIYNLSLSTYIEKLLLPTPSNKEEDEIYQSICSIAKEHGIAVLTYEKEFTCAGANFKVYPLQKIERSQHAVISFSFVYNNRKLAYINPGYFETDAADRYRIFDCHYLFFGSHGPVPKLQFDHKDFKENCHAFFSNNDLLDFCNFNFYQNTVVNNRCATIYSP